MVNNHRWTNVTVNYHRKQLIQLTMTVWTKWYTPSCPLSIKTEKNGETSLMTKVHCTHLTSWIDLIFFLWHQKGDVADCGFLAVFTFWSLKKRRFSPLQNLSSVIIIQKVPFICVFYKITLCPCLSFPLSNRYCTIQWNKIIISNLIIINNFYSTKFYGICYYHFFLVYEYYHYFILMWVSGKYIAFCQSLHTGPNFGFSKNYFCNFYAFMIYQDDVCPDKKNRQ